MFVSIFLFRKRVSTFLYNSLKTFRVERPRPLSGGTTKSCESLSAIPPQYWIGIVLERRDRFEESMLIIFIHRQEIDKELGDEASLISGP
jgi:hypothetical protein